MTNTEFKTKLTEAFKTHMFMKDRDYHTVNELLYILEHDNRFDKEDFNRIMLEVNENNNPAIKLYTKLGFKEISYRERYYDEDTALIMEKVK